LPLTHFRGYGLQPRQSTTFFLVKKIYHEYDRLINTYYFVFSFSTHHPRHAKCFKQTAHIIPKNGVPCVVYEKHFNRMFYYASNHLQYKKFNRSCLDFYLFLVVFV
jgi:hypothetical protein